jgi:hypothetical protein
VAPLPVPAPVPTRVAPLPWWRVFWNWLTGRGLPTAGNGG